MEITFTLAIYELQNSSFQKNNKFGLPTTENKREKKLKAIM